MITLSSLFASISRIIIFRPLKIEFDALFVRQDIPINNADFEDIVFLQFSRNFRNIPSERFKVVGALVVITHAAGRHKVFNVVRAGILLGSTPSAA